MILCLTVGCQDRVAMAELEAMRARAQVEEQNKEIVQDLIAAMDAGNLDRLAELLAADFALDGPGLLEPWRKDELFQAIKSHYAAFPDWMHVIENVVADGNRVAIKLNQNGTHKLDYSGIPATGSKVTKPAMHLFTLIDGKVLNWFVLEDELGFQTQLGMEIRPTEGEN